MKHIIHLLLIYLGLSAIIFLIEAGLQVSFGSKDLEFGHAIGYLYQIMTMLATYTVYNWINKKDG